MHERHGDDQRGRDDERASRAPGSALDGMPARVDDHGAMPRVRSPICRGRWLLSGLVLPLLAIGSMLAARGGAQEAPRPLLLLISIAFFLIGPGVPAGRARGIIDLRDVAPTLARRLGLSVPAADGKILLP